MRVYIAAPFGAREDVRRKAAELEALGHEITQRWFDGGPLDGNGAGNGAAAEALKRARADMAGIRACNLFVFLPGFSGTGGKHWERGFATALGKRVADVGEPENVFGHLPGERHATWEDLLEALRREACHD